MFVSNFKINVFILLIIFSVSIFALNPSSEQSVNAVTLHSSVTDSNTISQQQLPVQDQKALSDLKTKKQQKQESPQDINAKGQAALNGVIAKKQEVKKQVTQSSSKDNAAVAIRNQANDQAKSANQAVKESAQNVTPQASDEVPQNAQIKSAENTKNIMPTPTLMQAESNQDHAENMKAEKNKQQFYDPETNQ